jgi:transposase
MGKKIDHYIRYIFPQLKRRALEEGRTLVFQDESSLSLQPLRVGTWAPIGQTPVIDECFNWKRLSLSASISNRGHLFFQLIAGSYTSERIIEYLAMLLQEIEGKIALFWDGVPMHRSRKVRDFLNSPKVIDRLKVHRLPPYAPELNPVEYLFSALKRSDLGNYTPRTLQQLEKHATKSLRKRKKNHNFIHSCFKASGLRFHESDFV